LFDSIDRGERKIEEMRIKCIIGLEKINTSTTEEEKKLIAIIAIENLCPLITIILIECENFN